MKLNRKTQLGLMISENHDLQLRIIGQQTGIIQNRHEHLTEQEISEGISNTTELVLDDGKYLNQNYLVKTTALEMVKKIPVDTPKFDIKFLKNLPVKKATFLLGKDLSMKYYKTADNVYAVFFRLEDTPEGEAFTWTWLRIEMTTGKIVLPVFEKYMEAKDSEHSILQTKPFEDAEFKLFVQLLLFVELSELEIEVLEPKRKTGTKKTGKYLNDSEKNVAIVDSKWNVVSVNNTGFLVDGHWRLQPCGEGRLKRKMIWIDTFEKKGYIRRGNGVTNQNIQSNV